MANGNLSNGTLGSPKSLGITLDAGECPSGTITLNDIKQGGAYWRNTRLNATQSINVYLCDSQGNNRVYLFRVEIAANSTALTPKTATISAASGLTGKALYIVAQGDTDYITLINSTTVTVGTQYNNYSIAATIGYGGGASFSHTEAAPGTTVTITMTPSSGYTANTPVCSGVTFTSAGTNKWTFSMPSHDVSISLSFSKITYSLTTSVSPSGGGTLTLSRYTAQLGDTVSITASPATGYRLVSVSTSPSLTINNGAITMPASNVTVYASFEKITYSISKSASPAAGGTVTVSRNTATYGDTVTVSQTPATGYYFNGWSTAPANLISGNAFTMPAQNVSVVANYLKRSTASLASNSLTGNGTVKLTISADKSTYSHKYKLSFGTNMETSWVNVTAGTTQVTISIPDSWSNYIPNATQKGGGTLTLETYSGSTKIGEYVISGLTYNVRNTAVPTLSDITKAIARTIGGTTYANVGDYYVQNKCGVTISATAAGVLSSTITSIACTLSGYSGNSYNKTVTNTTSLSYTTGLLSITGEITITVTATDSRGRTATKTATITVTPYNKPSGTLEVRRVDGNGDDNVLGTYAKFVKTSGFTAVGTNSLTVSLKSQGTTVTLNQDSGDILPGSRQTFGQLNEYNIELILQDAFETVSIIVKLPTAQLLIAAGEDGTRLALMKAINESLSKNGKTGVLELSDTVQIYVGSETLEDFIRRIANS